LGLQKGLFGMAKAVVWQNGFCLRQTICPTIREYCAGYGEQLKLNFLFIFLSFFF